MGRFSAVGDLWARTPATVRKSIVVVIGGTLVALGIALVVLPGPFTLPLLLAGFAVLGSEFAWASRVLDRTRDGLDRGGRAVKQVGSSTLDLLRRRKR